MAEVSQIESRDSEYKGINLHPYFSWHFTDTYNATSNPTGYWNQSPFSEYGHKLSDGWCHFELDNREGTATARSDFTVKNLGNTKDGSLYTVMLEFRNVNINKDGDSFYTVQSTAQVWGASATEPNATYGGFSISNAQLRQLSNGQGVFYKNILTNYRAKNNITTNIPMFMCLTWNVSAGQKVSADVRISVYEGANYRGPYVPFDPNTPVNPNFLKSIRTLTASKVPNLLSDPTFGTALGTYWVNTGLTASISNNSLIINGSSIPSGDHRIYQQNSYFVHEVGKMYTLSCDIVATQNCQISFGRKFRTSTDEWIDDYGVTFDVTTTEQHLSGSYIATKSAYHTFQISEVSNSATVTIKNIRLESTKNPNLLGDTLNPEYIGTSASAWPQYHVASGGNGVGSIETINDSPVSTYNKSFRITGNSSGNRDFCHEIGHRLVKGQKYVFSAYVRAINVTQCTSLIRFYSSNQVFYKQTTITNEWTKIQVIMTTDTWDGTTSIRVQFGLSGAGSIEYIAPTLTRLEPTDQRIHRNLIWDTQWKKLDSGSWTAWGSPTTREIVEIDGKRWLHLITTTAQYQGWQQDAGKRSGFGAHYVQELIPGENYTVSFDAYASEATTITSIIGFHWKDKRGTNLSQNWSAANLTTTPQRFNFQYTAPANATSFNIMIGDSSTTAHELWISNLFFTKGANSTNYNKRYQPAPEDCDEAVAGYEESNPNLYAIKRARDGFINYDTGYVSNMNNTYMEQISDFIPVTAGEHIYFQAWSKVASAANHWIGYGLYNSNKQFISRTAKYDGIKDVNGFTYNYYDITIPSGTAYIRCCYRRNQEGYAKVERGNLPTNWTPALEDIVEDRKQNFEYQNYDLRDDYSTWGGRNLALNTKKLDQTMAKTNRCMSWYGSSSTVVENYKNGFSASQVGNVNWCGLGVHLAQMDLKVGELYTASAYADVTTSATTGLVWYLMCYNSSGTRVYPSNTTTNGTPTGGGTKSTGTYYCTVTNTWTQECQNLIDAGGTISFTFQTSSNTTSGNQVYWYKPKFEKGSKATDWSPAPEDLMRYIGDETIELYSG